MPTDTATNLSNCDREPIHVPGKIQPFGFLLCVGADWHITRASENVGVFLPNAPDTLVGRPLADLFARDTLRTLRSKLSLLRGPDAVERMFGIMLADGLPPFDIAIHSSGAEFIVEAEPALEQELEAAALIRAMVARLSQTDGMMPFLREGARQVRAITGFDRVKVYRFDAEGSGEVVAEALRPGVDSFLGLHYPATDIPAQARTLYLRNIFRVISDVDAAPVAVLPTLNSQGQVLDQSLSLLRAVSPIHVEYLKNMGVKASLSISIIVDGKLWGLFACHHYAPRLPGFKSRTAAELFGQMFSFMLESRERRDASDYENSARALTDSAIAAAARDPDRLRKAEWLGEAIFGAIPADGICVRIGDKVWLSGLTPGEAQCREIFAALRERNHLDVFSTDSISTLVPGAAAYADIAAGLIAISLSLENDDSILLFRAEQLRSVRWAGNPEKPVEYGPHGARLTPRKSFEEWSQLVKGRSLPFNAAEKRIAAAIRTGFREVIVRLAEGADRERQRAADRQQLLIAELNHRVRNILSLIRGLISQSRGAAQTTEEFVSVLDQRVQALARAHDQITRDQWGPGSLIELIETEFSAYRGAKRERVHLDGPDILLHPPAFTAFALVCHELVTNAAKYGALSDNGAVHISWRCDEDGSLVLDWVERGGPAVVATTRRGFGSTIIETLIPHDLGGSADTQFRLAGFEAHFCIPSRHVAGLSKAPRESKSPVKEPEAARPLEGRSVLLVEDSVIIALDGEDVLRDLGAAHVMTAANLTHSRTILETEHVDFALLDFNLGAETSLPIAEILKARGIPFAFATGYGDGLIENNKFPDSPIITKPYGMSEISRCVHALALNQPMRSGR